MIFLSLAFPQRVGTITKILGNDNGVNDFDVRGDKVVYAITEIKNPWEVHLLNLKDKSTRQLTELNSGWLKDKTVVVPKEYWFTRPDGTKIQYWGNGSLLEKKPVQSIR